MKAYEKSLYNLGLKEDWREGTIASFSNDKILMQVCEQPDGYHQFSVCPKSCFDRWANSRHINFRLMVKNYSKKKQCGWTKEHVIADFEKNVKDAIWLCDTIPERMFNSFIKIDLS